MLTPAAQATSRHVAGFQRWVAKCNAGSISGRVPFVVAQQTLGYVEPPLAQLLCRHNGLQMHTGADGAASLTLAPELDTVERRTRAMDSALRALRAQGAVTGWRDELYPVAAAFGDAPALLIERAAAPLLGVQACGVHVNGLVSDGDGLHIWVARRSASKPTWPGKLDHLAAGGQPHGIGLLDNVVKECQEEAGVPEALARRARSVGAVSYVAESAQSAIASVKRDVIFCFDLELPRDFVPAPVDGEVESFELWPAQRVMDTVAFTDDYKDNCNLVLIDLFLRHGLVSPDMPGYVALLHGLRNAACQ